MGWVWRLERVGCRPQRFSGCHGSSRRQTPVLCYVNSALALFCLAGLMWIVSGVADLQRVSAPMLTVFTRFLPVTQPVSCYRPIASNHKELHSSVPNATEQSSTTRGTAATDIQGSPQSYRDTHTGVHAGCRSGKLTLTAKHRRCSYPRSAAGSSAPSRPCRTLV